MLADFVTFAEPSLPRRDIDLGYLVFGCSRCDVRNVVVGGETVLQK